MPKKSPHLYQYQISYEPYQSDDGFVVPDELKKRLPEIHELAVKGRKSSVPKFEKLIKRFPNVPQLKNYLYILLQNIGEVEKAALYNQKILEQFPNYLFAKLNLAGKYMQKGMYVQVPEILGEEFELQALYPERKLFHVSEIASFFEIVIQYFAGIGEIEEAEKRFEILTDLYPEYPDVEYIQQFLFIKRFGANQNRFLNTDDMITVETKDVDSPDTATKAPDFHHPEIHWLYEEDLLIDKEKLTQLLQLPRKTLVSDLEKVLMDSIERYQYYEVSLMAQSKDQEKNSFFAMHAFFLLGELQAKESHKVIWELMRQHNDYYDLFFGDVYLECMWEVLYKVFHDDFEALSLFMKEPGIVSYSKSSVMDVVLQVALHDPKRKPEAEKWLIDMLVFFNNCTLEDNIIDSETTGFLVWTLLSLELPYIPPTVKELYDKKWVEISMLGDYEEVEKIWFEKQPQEKRALLSMADRYRDIIENWHWQDQENSEDDFFHDEFDSKNDIFDQEPEKVRCFGNPSFDDYHNMVPDQQRYSASKKIGRNDPCPCGSGKKYKKCCMNKID